MDSGAILVTGAAGAFGSHLVVDLLNRGQRVFALGRSEARLRTALDQARQRARASWEGGALTTAGFELDDVAAWRRLLDEAEGIEGSLGGAVLATGGWTGGTAFTETSDEAWHSMFARNLESVRLALLHVLPVFERSGGGSVVLIGSRAAVRPWESSGAAAYAASKAALVALAQTLAAEVLEANVRVNVVLPSTIEPPARLGSALGDAALPEDARLVPAASLADVVRFLLSSEARSISGAAIPVYGRA